MSKYKKVLCAFVDVRSAEDGMAFASANFIPNVKQIHNELKESGCSAMFDKNKYEMFCFKLCPDQKESAICHR